MTFMELQGKGVFNNDFYGSQFLKTREVIAY